MGAQHKRDVEIDTDFFGTGMVGNGHPPILTSVVNVPVSEIYVEPQFREYFDPVEIGKLRKSIEENGFEGSILVKELSSAEKQELENNPEGKDYKYLLIYGESRLRAIQLLEHQTIPATVKDEYTTIHQVRRLRADENLIRNNFNPVEEANTILEMMADEIGVERDKLVSFLDNIRQSEERGSELWDDVVPHIDTLISVLHRYKGEESTLRGFLKTWRSLQKLPTDILDAIRNDLPYTKAIELKSIKDDAAREELLQEVIDGNLTIKQIRQRKKELKQQSGASGKTSQSNEAKLPLTKKWNQFVEQLPDSQAWKGVEKSAAKKKEAQRLLQQLKDLLES